MLVEFRVENYKSFKEAQTLSMVASSDDSLAENTITVDALGKRRLLRSAVVYGANASGKSNLVDAFDFVRSFVAISVEWEPGKGIPVKPFLLDEVCAGSPSTFEVTFIHEGVRYQYGFSVDRERVHEEWLVAYPRGKAQTWYERPAEGADDAENWYFGPGLKGEKKRLVPLTRPDALFLSVGAKFAHEQLTGVHEWFSPTSSGGLLAMSGTNEPGNVRLLEQATAFSLYSSKSFRKFSEVLMLADLGISDVSIEQTASLPDADLLQSEHRRQLAIALATQKPFDIRLEHRTQDDADTGIYFPWEDESHGTRRFFGLLGPWQSALGAGGVLVIDEIDASLHPLLVRALVELFHDPETNPRGAQLIFNTHDTTQLDSTLFRRDQVWFVEKDAGGASHLYPLLDYKPRKGEALEKGYLAGRYGAIPFLGSLEGFTLDGED